MSIVIMNENDINFRCVNQQVNNKLNGKQDAMDGLLSLMGNWQ